MISPPWLSSGCTCRVHLSVITLVHQFLDPVGDRHVELVQGVTHVLDKRGQDILFVSGQFAWHTTRYHKRG